ncbi:MAG TPA: MBL fold metallo-hydrolase [Polyangiaceae bacterium]|nr:MBL fold metallo-hydrolase [Polyangiaceae bacterium]
MPSRASQLRRWVVRALALGLLVLCIGLLYALWVAWVPMGKMASGNRLARMQKNAQYKGDHFVDLMPRVEPNIVRILPKWFETPVAHRRPTTLPTIHPSSSLFNQAPNSGLRVTWLGHSTLMVEIEGQRLLIDPVWGEYVSPLPLKNAQRFAPPPLPFEQLPPIDAVLISHDHYDHLDYPTVLRLNERGASFHVPLGVGSHLAYWGVPESRIFEYDWWQEHQLSPALRIVCTPARHFSGRSLVDKDHTLWAGWALLGDRRRVYYSGDTALFPGFSEIGERFGPFDLTMIESGAYNQMWADVHLGPEQAVIAHQLLRGKLLFPVHWGMFDLGLHGWTEPVERIVIAAQKAGVPLVTVPPGGSFEIDAPPPIKRWWPSHPFQTVEQSPAFSSGVDDLLRTGSSR